MSKYIDAERLKAEIERLKGQLIRGACAAQIEMETNCKEEAYDEVLSFLSTLESERPVPNDLEEAAKEFAKDAYPDKHNLIWMFKRGAKWQAEQMLKEAVEVRVQTSPLNGPLGISAYCCNFPPKHPFYHCKEGDNVRVIILPKEAKQ